MSEGKERASAALTELDSLLREQQVNGYEMASMMSPELQDELGNGLYAFSANMDAMTQDTFFTEEEIDEHFGYTGDSDE